MAAVPPEVSFEDLIQSDLFTFHIGEEKKPFVVHSKAVAATSKYFRALVTGDMAESQTRSAELQEVRPEDFARFLEYAYRHDYTIPPCAKDLALPDRSVFPRLSDENETNNSFGNAIAAADLDWGSSFTSSSKTKKKKKKDYSEEAPQVEITEIQSKFKLRKYLPDGEPKTAMLKKFVPEPNSKPEQDFTLVFLAHARLYTFASAHLIDPLKALALYKLHKTLANFQLYYERVGDILELARYAYNNGEDRKEDGTIEELRILVVEYIAWYISTFGKHKDFLRLLEEGGEFASDIWRVAFNGNLQHTS